MSTEPSTVVASPELALLTEVTLSGRQQTRAVALTPEIERSASGTPPVLDDQEAPDEYLALSVTEPATASDSELELLPLYRIKVSARHLTDIGDLTCLGESIRQIRLLQPITVTSDVDDPRVRRRGACPARSCRDRLTADPRWGDVAACRAGPTTPG